MAADPAVSQNSGENRDGRARSDANLKPFEKGRSGNPGGRPKGLAKAVRDVPVEQGSGDGAVLLAKIGWQIVSDPKVEVGSRIRMWEKLAERGWGKPAEFVPIEDADPLEMSEQEADAIASEFAAKMDDLAARRAARSARDRASAGGS